MFDPPHWTFDVASSDHDAVKRGIIVQRWSRVHISRDDFPVWQDAASLAGVLAVSMHGGMPTSILPVY